MIIFYSKSEVIFRLKMHGNTNSVKMCKMVVDNSATARNPSRDLIQQSWDFFSKQERCIQSLSWSFLLNQSLATSLANISISMKGGGRSNQFNNIEAFTFNQRLHGRHMADWWCVQIESRPWNEANHLAHAYSS